MTEALCDQLVRAWDLVPTTGVKSTLAYGGR